MMAANLAADWLLLAVDAALAILGLEAAVLIALRRRRGIGLPVMTVMLIALAGAGLLLALRFSLSGAGGLAIATCLTLAGLAHAADLARRLLRSDRG
jgi:hypothetical protein